MLEKTFYELIRVALGKQTCLSHTPSADDWKALYEMAKKQSLVGVCFAGVQRLVSQRQAPPEMLYLQWMGMAAKIQQRNEVLNKQCAELQTIFAKSDLKCCILKGQGVALAYPKDLSALRQSGDIDIWIDHTQKEVLEWASRIGKVSHYDYMHVCVDIFKDISVELHYRPMISRNVLRNEKLQSLSRKYDNTSFEWHNNLGFYTPCPIYNLIHVFHHIYWHLMVEGVGIRQIMDLYFLLLDYRIEEYKHELQSIVSELGLTKFCSALMWIFEYVFHMDNKYFLCEPNEKEGRFLLDEVLISGNMGHHDIRITHTKGESDLSLVFKRLKHVWRLVLHYPVDVLWSPIGVVYLSLKKRI